MNVHPFIEAEKQAGPSVTRACELLKVSRAAYFARRSGPSARTSDDAELTEKIRAVHARSRDTYGSPRVKAALNRDGTVCGRRRVARLMQQADLTGITHRRRQRTTIPDPKAAIRPDLVLRDFQPNPAGADTRWCGDITYIPTDEGWLYLPTVIDIRRVVGWTTADHLRTSLVADTLTTACRTRRPTEHVIFPSDRGCQYTSHELAPLAAQLNVRLPVGRTGQCWDNALAESSFSTLKNELLGRQSWGELAGRPRGTVRAAAE